MTDEVEKVLAYHIERTKRGNRYGVILTDNYDGRRVVGFDDWDSAAELGRALKKADNRIHIAVCDIMPSIVPGVGILDTWEF